MLSSSYVCLFALAPKLSKIAVFPHAGFQGQERVRMRRIYWSQVVFHSSCYFPCVKCFLPLWYCALTSATDLFHAGDWISQLSRCGARQLRHSGACDGNWGGICSGNPWCSSRQNKLMSRGYWVHCITPKCQVEICTMLKVPPFIVECWEGEQLCSMWETPTERWCRRILHSNSLLLNKYYLEWVVVVVSCSLALHML